MRSRTEIRSYWFHTCGGSCPLFLPCVIPANLRWAVIRLRQSKTLGRPCHGYSASWSFRMSLRSGILGTFEISEYTKSAHFPVILCIAIGSTPLTPCLKSCFEVLGINVGVLLWSCPRTVTSTSFYQSCSRHPQLPSTAGRKLVQAA